MPATLCIHVTPHNNLREEDVNFFEAEEWNEQSEEEMIQKLLLALKTVKTYAKNILITIDVETNDVGNLAFHLNKKIGLKRSIQTQNLTSRELEILSLIMQGMTNHEIAEKLFISYETVKSHRKHILVKTGAKNTAALINYYHQAFFEK